MKKHFLSIIVLLTLALSVSAVSKKDSSAGGFNYIKMERTLCYGTCPNYSIEIYANGLIRYTGKRFAQPDGTYEKNLGKKKVQEIFKEMAEYNMDTCQREYQNLITDVPGIYYTFKKGMVTFNISNAHFGPAFLKTLAIDMDVFMGTPGGKGWKKTASYKQPK